MILAEHFARNGPLYFQANIIPGHINVDATYRRRLVNALYSDICKMHPEKF